jgi:hypothetical protein
MDVEKAMAVVRAARKGAIETPAHETLLRAFRGAR